MSIARHHAEWLSLIDVSGPFLSLPVLEKTFPQGLDAHDPDLHRRLRLAYDEWDDSQSGQRTNPAIHLAWIRFVLGSVLELPAEVLAEGQAIPPTLKATVPEFGEILRPDLVVKGRDDGKVRLLVHIYPKSQDFKKPVLTAPWKKLPETRMAELLRTTGVTLGLVTNGEQWMLVNKLQDQTAGFASWFAALWLEEHLTQRAFRSLLGVTRFFGVPTEQTLEKLLAESVANQQEVTDQLGYQVRRAVEMLVQALDKADQDHGRKLLTDVSEAELYESALTVMMRLVFLFSAEERELLLLGDELYDQHFAVSTLREKLRATADQHGEEILERRQDAWCRLLTTFRTVYGGVRHDRLKLPAYGGNLFNPDRFPFLEGRLKATKWRETPTSPLPINNRTVLHLLEALQVLQIKVGGGPAEARRLSFRALGIEQIGHVYEGLLDHTAKRAAEPILGLAGTKDREPEISLAELEKLQKKGEKELLKFLKEETGRSESALKKALQLKVEGLDASHFQTACQGDDALWRRVQKFAGLVREDTYGYPVVVPTGSVYVTQGTDRRSSGTHYTPRSLTEPIVEYTLQPLVYIGPAEGKPENEWQLCSARELLNLKVCDMAAGSGAFLVQACRYLSELLVEAWRRAEEAHPGVPGITPEGEASSGQQGEALIPKDTTERLVIARRLIAQRCLYGVDKNPLAVEMAKLSLWLLTMARDTPFTFLDHAIRCGDSLVGIHDLNQLRYFNLAGNPDSKRLFLDSLEKYTDEAMGLRRRIEEMPVTGIEDVQRQEDLLKQANEKIERLKIAADLLIADAFQGGDEGFIKIACHFRDGELEAFQREATKALGTRLTFHWPLEFPEVFGTHGGFDAFVGNPPFMGGLKLETQFGREWRAYLVQHLAANITGVRGTADLCAYFFLRAFALLHTSGRLGLIATNTIAQGDTREIGLERIAHDGGTITRAIPSRQWPGVANLEIAMTWISKGVWQGDRFLADKQTPIISTLLTPSSEVLCEPQPLKSNEGFSFQGSNLLGAGFILAEEEAERLIAVNPKNREVILPYLTGEDLNSRPDHAPRRWAINFYDWDLPTASKFTDCIAIVKERVKPERDNMLGRNPMSTKRGQVWWRYAGEAKNLYVALSGLNRTLVRSRVSNLNSVAFSPTNIIFSDATVVFAYDDYFHFASLQSSVHTVWLEQYASTMRTDVRYVPSRCFDTFSFATATPASESSGHKYDECRKAILLDRSEGLTKLYTRFNDKVETSADIQKLRQLHVEMDNTIAAAYGWTHLDLGHGFHETRQGVRYTISELARLEVLLRLLKLNHERYAEEVAQGQHEKKKPKTKQSKQPSSSGLFD